MLLFSATTNRLRTHGSIRFFDLANYSSFHFSPYLSNDLYTGRVNCLQANVILLIPNFRQQNIHTKWTCFNCSAPNKIKWSLFWVSIINRTVPPLKKKREKNGKCIPKCWEFFGFWLQIEKIERLKNWKIKCNLRLRCSFVCTSKSMSKFPNLRDFQLFK